MGTVFPTAVVAVRELLLPAIPAESEARYR
jgi:hypothetical protein